MVPNSSFIPTSAEPKVNVSFPEVKNSENLPELNSESVCCECEKHFTFGSVKNSFPRHPMFILLKDEKVFKSFCHICYMSISESNIIKSFTYSEYLKHKGKL
jgi:hypothetical protein